MKNFLITGILAFILSGCANEQPYPWHRDVPFQSVLDQATGTLVLIDFYTDWCGPCKMMDENTFSDDKVKAYANQHFVSMKVNAEKGEGVELSDRYNIRGYPTILFVNDKGEEVDRMMGYREPEDFLKELNRVQSGKNTLPALLMDFQKNPNKFSTLFKLAKKYEGMGDGPSAQRMIGAILAANVDSAGTAAFFEILYDARETRNPRKLIEFANDHSESEYLTTALEEAMFLVRREGKEPLLEADLFYRLITAMENPSPGWMNSFAWRMSELEVNLSVALEKINLAIETVTDAKQKHMFMDTKAEILWKLDRVDEAISEIQKCIDFDPEDTYYKEQLEKFQKGKPVS